MKYLLTGVAAITMLTACGQKDKPEGAADSAGIVFSESKIPSISVQKGDAGTAAAALAAMALETSGSGNVSWDGRDLKGATAVFTDVTLASAGDDEDDGEGMSFDADDDSFDLDGADLKAAKMEFEGLAMKDGQATFSRLLMSDVSLVPTDPEEAENGSGKIGSIELVNPSPEMAAWVASLFSEEDVADLPEGDALAFDKWAINDVDFRIDDPNGEQGTFTVGNIEVTGLKEQTAALMKLDGMTFDMFDPSEDAKIKFNLASVELHGADLSLLTDASEDATDPEEMSQMMNLASQDPANPELRALVSVALAELGDVERAILEVVETPHPVLRAGLAQHFFELAERAEQRGEREQASRYLIEQMFIAIADNSGNTDKETLQMIGFLQLNMQKELERCGRSSTDLRWLYSGALAALDADSIELANSYGEAAASKGARLERWQTELLGDQLDRLRALSAWRRLLNE